MPGSDRGPEREARQVTMALVVLAVVAVVLGAAGACPVLHHRSELRTAQDDAAAEHAAAEQSPHRSR